MIRKIIRKIITKCSVNWYNPLISVVINFYHLPFEQAKFLPIACYGWPRFISMHGNICIEADNIYFKMIRLNVMEHQPYSSGVAFEYVNDGGTLIFNGSCSIMSGCRIMLYSEGKISFGANCRISTNCNLGCQKEIIIGNNVNIGADIVIYDTNFHYIYNINKQSVKNSYNKISIGDNVWLGTRSYISKGTIIAKGCIISANTVISRPLRDMKEYSIIAGNPAKVVAEGYTRITGKLEGELFEKFSQNGCRELPAQYEI